MYKYLRHLTFTWIFIFIASTTLIAQTKTVTLPSGTGFWKPPIGCTSFYVELWGGGAGGNTGSGDGSLSTGGGGGGNYAKSTTFFVTSTTFNNGYQFSVGAAGDPGSNGGDTWFYNTLCLAPGGRTRPNAQADTLANQFIQRGSKGGGGGSSWRNIFGQIWHGGGGGAGRRAGNGYVGGNADYNFTGGGAEGYAYDNVNVTPGRGGQDGPYFPGIPGGGGAGNQTGASGIIIITYSCDYNPGSIRESHTVPYPAEWSPFNDVISNAVVPTFADVYTYNYMWESSKDNSKWTIQPAMSNRLNTFVQDSITLNTSYRRTITNGCGTNNSTDPVLIRVFTATTGKNGGITGKVTSINGQSGVGGVIVTAQKTRSLQGSPQSFKYFDTTKGDGTYVLRNIFYGDEKDDPSNTGINFVVTASLNEHKITGPQTVALSFNYNTAGFNNKGIDFIDSTVYSIIGKITQTCDSCFEPYKGPFGVGNVKIDVVSVPNTNSPVFPITSNSRNKDSLGLFGISIANPGTYRFTPSFLNHKFDSASRTIPVTANRSGINFSDTTTHVISGKLTDVGGRRIGSATLLFEGVSQLKDSTLNIDTLITTFKARSRIKTGDSTYSVRLPAGKYRVSVDTFLSAFLLGTDPYISEGSVKDFFKNLAVEPLIDISNKDSVRNLVYHRAPVVKIFRLRDTACNTNPAKNPGLVFRTNVPKRFEGYVYEGPESIGDKIQIYDVDNNGEFGGDSLANYLRFYTDVTKRGATENADTLFFRLKNTQGVKTAMIDSFLIPGAPNFTPNFRKTFKVYYWDRYGRKAAYSSDPFARIPDSTTVVGTFSPTNTFTTVSPEVPFLILHQPPGDNSYSFWSKDSSIQTSTTMKAASLDDKSGFVNVSLGPKFSIEAGSPSFEIGVEIEARANLNYTYQKQVFADTLDELVTTTTIKQTYRTNPSKVFNDTIGGDVYIGNAINYILGKSITVDFVPNLPANGCLIDTASRLFMAPDSVKTEFVYTENNIEKVIIPTQLRLMAEATTDSARVYHKTQADVWRQVIDDNEKNKKNAKFIRNLSFSAGPGVSYSEETSNSKANTITWETVVSNNFAAELGFYAAGAGASGGVVISLQQTTGGSKTTASSKANEIGYWLEDDDQDGNGDYFSVNIKKDSVYGTPVFDLFAGTSSCPPEQGAQNRDQPQIISGDMRFDNLDVNTPKFFDIILTNKSESGEARNYAVSVDAATSEGLVISASGSNNLVTDALPYYNMAYGTSQKLTIKVEKFSKSDKILSYPKVEFYLADMCENGPQIPNTYSTAKISFNYASTCGGINLTGPADGFVVNSANPLQIPITMGGYTLNNIDSITLQYQKKALSAPKSPDFPWEDGFTVKRNAITDPTSFTNLWNINNLPDSVYNLRLRLVCKDTNAIYSDVIAGVVDRKAPVLIGTPQPITGLYVPGSNDISFSYSELIDNSNLNNGIVELLRRSNNSLVPVTVTAVGGKLIVTPVTDLGLQKDSFRVIVRNVADRYGNVKSKPDTSFFKLGAAPTPVYTGSNIGSVSVDKSSIAENSTDSVAVYFKLTQKATKVTKVYFNVTGTAVEGADYIFSYDTVKIKKCNNLLCTDYTLLPVLNDLTSYPAYVNIDSGQTQAILFLHPQADAIAESGEIIRISLLAGGEYKVKQSGQLQDSAEVTVLITDAATSCPPSNILYVNAAATGNNTGASWQHAMRSLKEALSSACPAVTQIWVAKGSYKPTTNTSRDSSFVMKNNLAIYGGFAGTETLLSQRNIRNNTTILSGDIGIANSNTDNSYNVVRNISNGLNSTAILDGFIVTGGRGNGAGFGSYGAGIINVGSTPSFYNCSIIGNSADAYGGGMYNNGTAPTVVNSVFAGNTALYGGGLYNESAATKLINCSFSANVAFAEGGAISTYGAVTPEVTNSVLWGNSSGIRNAGGSTPSVTYSIVQGGYAGTGNLNTDPLFVLQPAPALGTTADLRLIGCSPAVNGGSNVAVPVGITTDLGSLPRIANTLVDMGAYERQSGASVIIYVDSSAKGNNSGDSWANAYPSLSSALTELNLCSPGTTIQVAAGTYIAPVNNTYNFDKLGAVILGGYPSGGGATRTPAVNKVVLRGNVQVLKSVRMDGIYVQKVPNGTGKLSLIQQTIK